jgi:hypothetical protein
MRLMLLVYNRTYVPLIKNSNKADLKEDPMVLAKCRHMYMFLKLYLRFLLHLGLGESSE